MKRAQTFVGFRYMSRFQCIGAACEDHCCHEWDVLVDETHYRAIEGALGALPDGSGAVDAAMRLTRDGQPAFALMVLRPDRSCSMLDADRLCSIQRRWGEPLLPDVCAVYPRAAARIGDRVELSGSVSCPEVARLLLLADDATAIDEIDAGRIGRGSIERALDAVDPFAACFDEVRGFVFQLASARAFPVASRLFFIAFFAERTRDFFVPDAARFDAVRLENEGRQLGRRETLLELHRSLELSRPPESFALSVVLEVLGARFADDCPQSFRRLAGAVLARYGIDGAISHDDKLDSVARHVARVIEPWRERRAALPPSFAARIEQYLGNYCAHFWIKEWYTRSPSFVAHTFALLTRVAVLRFLLLNHPSLDEATLGAPPTLADLDAAAVETFYSVARVFDHAPGAVRQILDRFAALKMDSLSHAVGLIAL